MPAYDVSDWQSQRWRLSNLYWIQNERGIEVPFRPNTAQLKLLDDLWYLNVILKSRQHGFTTFIDLMGLDVALWTPNQNVGIIAHGLVQAQEIFRTKIAYPYRKLPDGLKQAIAPVSDTKTDIEFANGSKVSVATSMRSGTVQFLHVSEFGKISRRYPDKAQEIVTGSFQAVHPGQFIFVESTAEGRDGYFYDLVQNARKARVSGRQLTTLDFRFHFFAWHHDQRNRLDPTFVTIPERMVDYFDKLEREEGIVLDAWQRAWYVKKEETLQDNIYAEHPSTADEAFKASADGMIYGRQMMQLRERGRITKVEHIEGEPVNTFWDLGKSDTMSIWFHQFVAGQDRFIRYFGDSMKGTSHYVRELQKRAMQDGYVYGRHYLPHDAAIVRLESMENKDGRSFEELLNNAGVADTEVVPRIESIGIGIDITRRRMLNAVIDEEHCAEGIRALENYQYVWDEKLGAWTINPRHDWASHPADAFRQWAQGYRPEANRKYTRRRNRSHRTA